MIREPQPPQKNRKKNLKEMEKLFHPSNQKEFANDLSDNRYQEHLLKKQAEQIINENGNQVIQRLRTQKQESMHQIKTILKDRFSENQMQNSAQQRKTRSQTIGNEQIQTQYTLQQQKLNKFKIIQGWNNINNHLFAEQNNEQCINDALEPNRRSIYFVEKMKFSPSKGNEVRYQQLTSQMKKQYQEQLRLMLIKDQVENIRKTQLNFTNQSKIFKSQQYITQRPDLIANLPIVENQSYYHLKCQDLIQSEKKKTENMKDIDKIITFMKLRLTKNQKWGTLNLKRKNMTQQKYFKIKLDKQD